MQLLLHSTCSFLPLIQLLLTLSKGFLLLLQLLIPTLYVFLTSFQSIVVFFHLALVHPKLNLLDFHQLFDRWPLSGIFVKHPGDNVIEVLAIPLRYPIHFAVDNLPSECEVVSCLEGRLQGHYLIQYTA